MSGRLTFLCFFCLSLVVTGGIGSQDRELPAARRLSPPVTFYLQTEKPSPAQKEGEGPVSCAIQFRRGRLTLGMKAGDRLLTAAGTYEWDVDEPRLEGTPEAVTFISGRRDLLPPSSWQTIFSSLPRYELWLGLPLRRHEFRFLQEAGQAELNLAGVSLAEVELDLKSGRLEAYFGDNRSGCRAFTFRQAAGTTVLSGLGKLAAANYYLEVSSGNLTAVFDSLPPAAPFALTLRVNAGMVTVKLPPGLTCQARVTVRAGLVYLYAQRCPTGEYELTCGQGDRSGILNIEVNSGLVRIS